MTTLLDTIRGNLEGPKSTAPALGQTEQVRGLIQAKSGKAAPQTSAPRQSSMKERMAAQQAGDAGKQIQQQGKIQSAQMGEQQADIQQRASQQEQQTTQSKAEMQQRFDNQISNVLQDFARGNRTLENRKDIAAMEQVGFLARFENQRYVDNLQKAGRQKRMKDSYSFKEEYARQALANHTSIVESDLNFRTLLEADNRTFMNELAQMDATYALQMADIAAKEAATQQMASGVSSLITGGAKMYGSGMFSSDPGSTGIPTPTSAEESANQSLINRGVTTPKPQTQSRPLNWNDLEK